MYAVSSDVIIVPRTIVCHGSVIIIFSSNSVLFLTWRAISHVDKTKFKPYNLQRSTINYFKNIVSRATAA